MILGSCCYMFCQVTAPCNGVCLVLCTTCCYLNRFVLNFKSRPYEIPWIQISKTFQVSLLNIPSGFIFNFKKILFFIHSFIAICRAHYVANVESEALLQALWKMCKFLSSILLVFSKLKFTSNILAIADRIIL